VLLKKTPKSIIFFLQYIFSLTTAKIANAIAHQRNILETQNLFVNKFLSRDPVSIREDHVNESHIFTSDP